jgi:hypothetical protein
MKNGIGILFLTVGGLGLLAGAIYAVTLITRPGITLDSSTFARVEWPFAICALSAVLFVLGRGLAR